MTARLIATARAHWQTLDGYAVAHGLQDLGDLSIPRFLNYIYYMITRNMSENDLAKFRAKLWQPPAGSKEPIDPRSPWSAENEARVFAALKAQATGSATPTVRP